MTKQNLVKEIANRAELTQKDVAKVIDVLPEIIKETVMNGDKIALTGFITFDKKHIEAKSGVSKLGGVEKAWSTPERDEISVKLSKTYKTL